MYVPIILADMSDITERLWKDDQRPSVVRAERVELNEKLNRVKRPISPCSSKERVANIKKQLKVIKGSSEEQEEHEEPEVNRKQEESVGPPLLPAILPNTAAIRLPLPAATPSGASRHVKLADWKTRQVLSNINSHFKWTSIG